jgi:hypothetical protein
MIDMRITLLSLFIDPFDLSSVSPNLETLHYFHSVDVGLEFRKSTHPTLRDILWANFVVLSSLNHSLFSHFLAVISQCLMHTVFNGLVIYNGSLNITGNNTTV